jgi:multidrug resistance efflux pump
MGKYKKKTESLFEELQQSHLFWEQAERERERAETQLAIITELWNAEIDAHELSEMNRIEAEEAEAIAHRATIAEQVARQQAEDEVLRLRALLAKVKKERDSGWWV